MQIAITVWQERISPVFDTARTVMLVRVEEGRPRERAMLPLLQSYPPLRVRRLAEHGVEVLICGAISRPFARMCECAGIRVIPWIVGPVDRVLEAFLRDELSSPEYAMPGCCGGRFRIRRRGRRNLRRAPGMGGGGRRHARKGDPT